MRVLGLNGWPGRGHDSAACLVVDGEIVAVAEEERFVRRKHAYGLAPHHAVAFCLSRGGITLNDVDDVAFGWDVPRLYRDRGFGWAHSRTEVLELLLPTELFPRQRNPELHFVQHHHAHAASVFPLSGHRRASILVIDGQGEVESATLMRARDEELETLATVPASWSLGYFYDAVCQYTGLGPDQAGKLMGLAAYGVVQDDTFGTLRFGDDWYEVAHVAPGLRSSVTIDENDEVVTEWLRHLETVLRQPPNTMHRRYNPESGRWRSEPERDPFEYRNVAATAQHALERAVFCLADGLLAETGDDVLLVSGGVGFNATLNGKLLEHPRVQELFVQPLAGDAGVAIGAAVHVARQRGADIKPMTTSIGWGIDFTPDVIRSALDESGLTYDEPDDLAGAVAKRICAGDVVGWFQGRGEVGPRALGHRSILADPRFQATRDRVNQGIKHREWWRPLAPSIAEEHFADYIDAPSRLPYMIVTRPLHAAARPRLAAVEHVDGTTRPQSVHAEDEPTYHRLLCRIQDEIGLPAVLNTSYNGHDEPIVWTPDDAIRSFARLGLGSLGIGPFLVRKD